MESRGSSHRSRAWAFVALLLLVVVSADLGLGVHCDEVVGAPQAHSVLTASPDSGLEPCDGVCVPDCFCCTILNSPATVSLTPPAVLPILVEAAPLPPAPDGTFRTPYHPPLAV